MKGVHSAASGSVPSQGEAADFRQMVQPGSRRLQSLAAHLATFAHEGQTYGEHPYVRHLTDVTDILAAWGCDDETMAAGWLHDVLEDTEVTWDTICNLFGPRVAWMVANCTGEGENRAERVEWLLGNLAATADFRACVVKLADRIANVEASKPGSDHARRYLAEQDDFAEVVRPRVSIAQWNRLELALERLAA